MVIFPNAGRPLARLAWARGAPRPAPPPARAAPNGPARASPVPETPRPRPRAAGRAGGAGKCLEGFERVAERMAELTGRPRPGTAARGGGGPCCTPKLPGPGLAAPRVGVCCCGPAHRRGAQLPASPPGPPAKAVPGADAGLGEGRMGGLHSGPGAPRGAVTSPPSHMVTGIPARGGGTLLGSLAVQTGLVLTRHCLLLPLQPRLFRARASLRIWSDPPSTAGEGMELCLLLIICGHYRETEAGRGSPHRPNG